MERSQIKKQAIKDKNVKLLCLLYFNERITPLQAKVIRAIAFSEYPRISVCAMTRWGKTFCVSRGIGLYILMNINKKIMFVGPQREQATILRDYMTDLVLKCEDLLKYADLDIIGIQRLKKEASKNRLTFKHGCEYKIFSAHGTATGLMGFGVGGGGGIVVKDEACLIDDAANTKITRMLGDNPEKTIFVELLNPWERDNKAFEHWNDLEWKRFHIGWKDALKEGRTTKEFIDRQRKELTPLEFTVLYDSKFPVEAEDSIFNLAKIKLAISNGRDLEKELKKATKEELKEFIIIISCDPADKGLDETVIFWGIKRKGFSQVVGYYSEPKSEHTQIEDRIKGLIKNFIKHKVKGIINLDRIGLGTGLFSTIKRYVRDNDYENIKVVGCHFGETAINDERFKNLKAENYFRLREIFIEKSIKIPEIRKLTNQLLAMKWDRTSTEKIIIVDPKKSPDWPDALVYFIWKDTKEFVYGFVSPRDVKSEEAKGEKEKLEEKEIFQKQGEEGKIAMSPSAKEIE